MNGSTLLFLLLVLACPLMMIWMMRGHGGHSHGAQGGCHGDHGGTETGKPGESLAELRRRRAELDSQIEQREADEIERSSPLVGKGR